jgi:hypothetical protein
MIALKRLRHAHHRARRTPLCSVCGSSRCPTKVAPVTGLIDNAVTPPAVNAIIANDHMWTLR